MVAVPVKSPQPGCIIFTVCANAAGAVIMAVAVVWQLFIALTVTIYVPAVRPVMFGVVCTGVVFQL